VTEFGINPDNVFQCGIGLAVVFIMECRWLTISLAIGFDNFDELLGGANEMDDHFKQLILIRICRLFLPYKHMVQ
jgi:glucose-6-phosphate isomerase